MHVHFHEMLLSQRKNNEVARPRLLPAAISKVSLLITLNNLQIKSQI